MDMWNSRGNAGPPSALRFAELYARALDRLGDPRPTQRVGAIHTLEVLAQDSPMHRQAIVDVFCAILRGPAGDDVPVRMAVQRTLAQHLYPNMGAAFWAGISVDLTGASLVDLDLSGCRIDGAFTLDHAVLTGQTKLRQLTIGGQFSLQAATFTEHVWFERSACFGPVRGGAAVFEGDAWFGEAMFAAPVRLPGARFNGHAWFGNCTFRARLELGDALFRRSAGFRGAVLYQGVGLTGTTFLGPARVSLRDNAWNVSAPGWQIVVDPDNHSVGQLLWTGHPALVEPTPV
jgi:hypothetical protein